jgi:hypothetical protein
VPTVSQFNNIQYTLSLSSDPLTGPFTSSLSIVLGSVITIRLNQQTAGPVSTVVVLFGDGSAAQSSTLMSSSVNITKNYSTVGTFTISATATLVSLTGVNTSVNTMTVSVASPPSYECKLNIVFDFLTLFKIFYSKSVYDETYSPTFIYSIRLEILLF